MKLEHQESQSWSEDAMFVTSLSLFDLIMAIE